MMELNRIYNMDCMEGMKKFPDSYFDLAIVDPPYGINAPKMNMGSAPNRKKGGYPSRSTTERMKERLNSGSGRLKNRVLNNSNFTWDNAPPDREYFSELFRVSKNQIIWGGNYFPLPPTRGIICWDKMQPWDNFSQFELAWTSYDKPAAMIRISNTGGNNLKAKIHPTEKPVELYRRILDKYAQVGFKILDTHAGSCNSIVACEGFGFEYLAFEINEGYYRSGVNNVIAHRQQLDLFKIPKF